MVKHVNDRAALCNIPIMPGTKGAMKYFGSSYTFLCYLTEDWVLALSSTWSTDIQGYGKCDLLHTREYFEKFCFEKHYNIESLIGFMSRGRQALSQINILFIPQIPKNYITSLPVYRVAHQWKTFVYHSKNISQWVQQWLQHCFGA